MSFLDFQKKIHKVGVFLDRPNQVFKNFKIEEVYFLFFLSSVSVSVISISKNKKWLFLQL